MAPLNQNSTDLNVLVGNKTLNGSVSVFQEAEYQFQLNGRSSFQLALTDLSGDASVQLSDGNGNVLAASANPEALSELINQTLDAGVYTVRVSSTAQFGRTDYSLSLTGQANQHSDLMWRNQSADVTGTWFVDNAEFSSAALITKTPVFGTNPNWKAVATGDFNGDGETDFVWRNDVSDQTGFWFLKGNALDSAVVMDQAPLMGQNASGWKIVGTGDFNGDGETDLTWQNSAAGEVGIWFLKGTSFESASYIAGAPQFSQNSDNWDVVSTGDFNGDGDLDLVFRNDVSDQTGFWFLKGKTFESSAIVDNAPLLGENASGWKLVGTNDFNNDGSPELLWQNRAAGQVGVWSLTGTSFESASYLANAPTFTGADSEGWQVVGTATRYTEPLTRSAAGSTSQTAFDIGALTETANYNDLLAANSTGYYQFTLASDQSVNFAVQNQVGTASGQLLDSDGAIVADPSQGVAAGTYYLRMTAGTTDAQYSLTLSGNTPFPRQFGSSDYDYASGVVTDGDGNVYVTGEVDGAFAGNTNAGGEDAFLAKYNSTGTQVWIKQFGTSDDDYASGVAIDSAGNVYVTGQTSDAFAGNTSAGGTDAFLAKYDSMGNQVWLKQFGTTGYDDASGVAIDSADNVYVTGRTDDAFADYTNAGNFDAFLAKYDSTGTQVSVKQFGTTGYDYASGVAVDSADNVYVAGMTDDAFADYTNAGSYDAFLAKYDSTGTQVSVNQFGTTGYDYGYGVAIDSVNNVYVAGRTGGAFADYTSAGGSDAFLAKYNSTGTQFSVKQFGTTDNDYASGVAIDSADNVYVTGEVDGTFAGNTNAGEDDAFLAKYDSTGTQFLVKQFGTTDYDYAYGVAVDNAGNVYVAGETDGTFAGNTNAGDYDAFLAKVTLDVG